MISCCLAKFNCIRMSVNIWKICLCYLRIDNYSLSSVEIMLGTSDMKVKKLKRYICIKCPKSYFNTKCFRLSPSSMVK